MRKIREMLIFSPHDLTKDAGFTRIDLITCRNVLIYMQSDLQYQVLRNLHFSLVSQGTLFLGEAETLGEFESAFEPLDKKWKFYQKQRDSRLPLPLRSSPKIAKNSLFRYGQPQNRVQSEPILEQCLNRLSHESDSIILLISKDNHLLHVSGDSSKIFKAPDGKITTEVIKMVVQPLQLPLNTALHRAKQKRKSVLYTDINLKIKDDAFNMSLEVIPPQSNRKNGDFFLVKIKQEVVTLPLEIPQAEQFQLGSEASRRILELEKELQQTRENLQALVEELETTNEEQQASNEELTASNEELQSTNEELHSVNEELHTVNVEYQFKIQELTELNNDIDNLLKSTDIGVIFLDPELKIRKFTPAATKAIALRQADIDRPLEELSYKIDCPELLGLLEYVLENKQPIEKEVKLKQRNFYFLMRINPYQTEDGQEEGIVISFVKVNEIKKVQRQLERTLVALRQSEAKLSQLNRELETRVEARTAELDRVNISLQKEIDIRQRAETIIKVRLKQQAAIAILGKQALAANELDNLFQQATILVAKNLDVEYTQVLELLEDGNSLLLRAGVGWSEVLVGEAIVGTDLDSQAGYTLIADKPVVVEDLRTETRFRGPALLQEHGIISGISTIIFAKDRPFGVFGAHTRQKRSFSQDDVNFLQAIVNILATAINARQDKQTLQDSEKRFRSAFEQAAVGVAHVATDGTWLRVNQKLCQIVGYTQEELLQKTFQDITHPEDLATDLEYVRQLLGGERKNYAMEKRYIHSNGSIVWINLTVSLVKQDVGVPDYSIAVIEDIGDRKQIEFALVENRKKLQQANQAKDSFIARMSHELRTPLNSVLGFSSVLSKDSSLTPAQLQKIDIVNQSGQHLLTLIKDILDFSKIEAGKLKLEPEEFNLIDFLADLTEMFQLLAREKNLNFEFQQLTPIATLVKADETRLRQVLLNLLSNAIKFTDTGSVIFTVSYLKKARPDTYLVRFLVRDTGSGIPQDKLNKIFLPFEQLDNNCDEQEGTGLGLAIAKDILQLMGSRIQVESVMGEGSKFWFDINLPPEKSASLDRATKSESDSLQHLTQSCKILVVDDNIDDRCLLVNYLQPLGFIVEEAQNGVEGLAKAETFQPDAILLDLLMPVMNGREMVTKIRQQPKLQDVLVLMVSANSQSMPNPEQIDCHALLSKPVDWEKLLELLTIHLELEWKSSKIASTTTADSQIENAPPQSELVELLKLAQHGDIETIKQKINSLAASNTQYVSFARQVHQLASSFQQNKLVDFIENFYQGD